jgi:hypothetical protein
MLVFVDESGDSGMRNKDGTSSLFVMAAVIFDDHGEALRCDHKIAELRKSLSRSGNKEYKFNTCNRAERETFFQGIKAFDFSYLAIVLNKAKLSGPGFQFKEPFYKYTAKLLFDNAKPYLNRSTVVIDGSGDRDFRKQLAVYIKRNVNAAGEAPSICKLKLEASHSNNLLQLVDMAAGAVARSLKTDKNDAQVYRGMIYPKELLIKVWPK